MSVGRDDDDDDDDDGGGGGGGERAGGRAGGRGEVDEEGLGRGWRGRSGGGIA